MGLVRADGAGEDAESEGKAGLRGHAVDSTP
jgi:hypothetical protein